MNIELSWYRSKNIVDLCGIQCRLWSVGNVEYQSRVVGGVTTSNVGTWPRTAERQGFVTDRNRCVREGPSE